MKKQVQEKINGSKNGSSSKLSQIQVIEKCEKLVEEVQKNPGF